VRIPSSCLSRYGCNSSHLFIEQKGDFVELERTGLEDLGNSQQHLPIQSAHPVPSGSLAGGPGEQSWLRGTAETWRP